MRPPPVPRLFVYLAAVVVAPSAALRLATAGHWNSLRDAAWLMALAVVAAHTADLAQAALIGWDLGIREGVFEVIRVAQVRLWPDLVALLIVAVLVASPARLAGRLSLDRSLALAAVCWMPLLLCRLAGHGIRLAMGHPPARPIFVPAHILESPEWMVGLLWCVLVAILAMVTLFGSRSVEA